ncbi:CBS domain-containing protein [Bowmanella denitrificans]|uniref:CBS domain-containing protein n=1 Tax=Bowmanella denitrificans TaxID=366582 RepID=UPI000C9A4EFC|nr:CBS domain-containing protein [Bowmanella denitrificans]
MKVSKIMSAPVVTVKMDDNLYRVHEIFQKHKFHHVLVVDGKTLLGVISDRDLLKAVSARIGSNSADARDMASFQKKVYQIMSRNLITINLNDSVLQAVRLFNRHAISCLPVVDDNKHWVGILSWRDIFRQIEKMKDSRAC